jgi:hypothetical protein
VHGEGVEAHEVHQRVARVHVVRVEQAAQRAGAVLGHLGQEVGLMHVAVAVGGDGVRALEHRAELAVDLVSLSAGQFGVKLGQRAARAERTDQAGAAPERSGGRAEGQHAGRDVKAVAGEEPRRTRFLGRSPASSSAARFRVSAPGIWAA